MNLDRSNIILGSRIDALGWDDLLATICKWGTERQSRFISICNVHSVVTAFKNPAHFHALQKSDINTPDGMPLVWMLRQRGFPWQERIAGPDLMPKVCRVAEENDLPVFFYGSTDNVLKKLSTKLTKQYPKLTVAGRYSPPFRSLSKSEDEDIVNLINNSGCGILFVGLGCPKQEIWMAEHRGKINSVMIGVGAAFDFHAEVTKRAPQWTHNIGVEWLYRLIREPRRLWKRYLYTNTLFLWFSIRDYLKRAK